MRCDAALRPQNNSYLQEKRGYTGGTTLLQVHDLNGSCSDPHHNPANVSLGCLLTGDSSDGKATERDENFLSVDLDSHKVLNALETLPRLSLAESEDLATSCKPAGCHNEF